MSGHEKFGRVRDSVEMGTIDLGAGEDGLPEATAVGCMYVGCEELHAGYADREEAERVQRYFAQRMERLIAECNIQAYVFSGYVLHGTGMKGVVSTTGSMAEVRMLTSKAEEAAALRLAEGEN